MRLKCWFLTGLLIVGTASAQAQTTRVIVTITGLVSIADVPSSKDKTLYLLNASDSFGDHVVPHIGVILANNVHVPTSLDGRKVRVENKSSWIRVKDAEKLIVKGGSTTVLDYVDTPPPGLPCPKLADRTSLYFFPRLSKFGRKNDGNPPDANDLDPAYLKPKKADEKIAAYMDVTFGELRAKVGSPAVWSFKESDSSYGATHEQMSAEAATWEFDIAGDTLVLQTSDDDGVTKKDMLSLKADSGVIRFTIANAPNLPKHIGVQYLAGTKKSSAPGPSDHHFQLYYEYLNAAVKKDIVRYFPVVEAVCIGTALSTDPCDIRRYVNIPKPTNCKTTSAMVAKAILEKTLVPPGPAIGNLNCGPDGMP
ncbi:MAG: hypothetical protein QOI24_2411 [Acidobacteriota bacterium]|jgi:hypothetical protein|nr:hypothetical protein [Acidobacteriota bacterium]